MKPASRSTVVVTAFALVLSGCTADGGAPAEEPPMDDAVTTRVEEAPCPTAFVAPTGGSVTCGYLTVPEDRSAPNGRTIRLFFSRWRPDGDLSPDPVLDMDVLVSSFGEGTQGANGIHRETIVLDERGTGRSEPSLACPELGELALGSLSAPSDDPQWHAGFLDAVTRCHDRLVGGGIDLGAYDLKEMAADAEDLRLGLGFEEWNLRGLGSGARLALEIMRRYPEHVRAAWLDSPELPQVDTLSAAIIGTRYALHQVVVACAEDRHCNAAFTFPPDLERAIARTLEGYGRHPLELTGRSLDGVEVPILLDDGLMLRALRELLTYSPELVPFTLKAPPSGLVVYGSQGLINDTAPFTYGYVPGELPHFTFAHGAFLSSLCRDQLAFTTQAELVRLVDGDPAYEQAFAQTPFFDACEVWGVGAADPELHEPVVSDVPTLLLVGRLAPYGPLPLVEGAAETLSTSWIVEFPNEGFNVLTDQCAVDLRNAWLDDPTSPPDTSCVEALEPLEFVISV